MKVNVSGHLVELEVLEFSSATLLLLKSCAVPTELIRNHTWNDIVLRSRKIRCDDISIPDLFYIKPNFA